MTDDTQFEIRPAPGKWVVFALGGIFGETANALQLLQGDSDPTIFIPREDMAMAFFDRTDHVTHSEALGTATHYSLDTKSRMLDNVAWSYEAPTSAAAAIRDHLTFDTEQVTVERQSAS